MISKVTVESFKTLEKVEVELGQVNVFVGANGSGKSNLLEAIGVLSAAADGKVDDQALLQRGVRPGVPELYKSAFQEKLPQHIYFAAHNEKSSFEVSLLNPLAATRPWRFKTEWLMRGGERVTSRSPRLKGNPNTERGLAALEALRLKKGDPARCLLEQLQEFVIYSPTTPVLRGTSPKTEHDSLSVCMVEDCPRLFMNCFRSGKRIHISSGSVVKLFRSLTGRSGMAAPLR